MEVYAGFLEHTDHHVGRLIDAIDDLGVLDNTIVYYIIGDNGASAEGTMNGAFNEMANFNGMAALETPEFMVSKMDELGSPSSYNHYSVGWAWAMDTPFQWTKQVASHWGGTRNGTIVHWPDGIEEQGGLRSQFTHVIDLAPTILEAAGLPEPTMVNGVQQSPMEGTSMLYTFDEPDAQERHDLQYFEMFGNRGIYHKGWSAVTKHRTPWVMVGGVLPAFDDDVWELYDGSSDYSQARNLAAEQPDMLAKLQRLWLIEATKYNVLPLDDRTSERLDPEMAGRPTLIRGNSQLFFPGMGRLSENSVVSIKNKSFSVTAEVDVPAGGADGVIIAQGGRFGGWAVYAKDGKAKFVYNVLGIQEFATEADSPIPAGTHQVRMEFAYDGGGLAKGGDVTLYYDGNRGRHRPRRGHPADDLLRRRDHRHRLRVRHHRHRRLHRRTPAASPARSTGCRSTSATTTTTTSSTPRNASASPWPGSRRETRNGITKAGTPWSPDLGRRGRLTAASTTNRGWAGTGTRRRHAGASSSSPRSASHPRGMMPVRQTRAR